MAELKIGQVASRAGVGIDTVRYYEKLGLLPTAARRESGYRVFDETTVERLRLIRHLQELGLPLDDIGAMLRATGATCAQESEKIRDALARTEEKIAVLEALRANLRATLVRCTTGECTFMEQLARVR